MSTEEIAHSLKLTAQLMELHDQNPFKIKSIANAAYKLDKTDIDLEGKTLPELEQIEGIGKSIAGKIYELQTTGSLKELNELLEKTPAGVIEMLGIKGIGPKKVGQLWRELEIESIGELLYACRENRLLSLKGFGAKTQEQVEKQIEFFRSNVGKYHYASVESFADTLVEELKKKYKTELVSLTGAMRRRSEVIDKVEILVGTKDAGATELPVNGVRVELSFCEPEKFYARLFESTGTAEHLSGAGYTADHSHNSEEEIYTMLGLQYIEPELREGLSEVIMARARKNPGAGEDAGPERNSAQSQYV